MYVENMVQFYNILACIIWSSLCYLQTAVVLIFFFFFPLSSLIHYMINVVKNTQNSKHKQHKTIKHKQHWFFRYHMGTVKKKKKKKRNRKGNSILITNRYYPKKERKLHKKIQRLYPASDVVCYEQSIML